MVRLFRQVDWWNKAFLITLLITPLTVWISILMMGMSLEWKRLRELQAANNASQLRDHSNRRAAAPEHRHTLPHSANRCYTYTHSHGRPAHTHTQGRPAHTHTQRFSSHWSEQLVDVQKPRHRDTNNFHTQMHMHSQVCSKRLMISLNWSLKPLNININGW